MFDFAGLGGVLLAGWALDRWFRGNWAAVGAVMSLGVIAGYAAVIHFGGSPAAVAVWFGLVGFMLYGPDTLLCGAASVQVAGEKNAVAVAGLVNGMGSIGSVVQEEVIGWLVSRPCNAGGAKHQLAGLGHEHPHGVAAGRHGLALACSLTRGPMRPRPLLSIPAERVPRGGGSCRVQRVREAGAQGYIQRLARMLPLPKGEGWGEGNSLQAPPDLFA